MERQCYVNIGACPAGELAGCSHPSSLLGRAGDRHGTVRLAPNLFVFPLSHAFRAGCDRLRVLSCLAPSPGRTGEGRRCERLPPRHPFRTSKALPALSVPAGSGPENVIRGGQCRAGPARALHSRWGQWIPPFAASTTLVTALLPGLCPACLSPGVPPGQPAPWPRSRPLSHNLTASHLSHGVETPRMLGAAGLHPIVSSTRI